MYFGAMDEKKTLQAALEAELEMTEETASAFALRARIHRHTILRLLNGADCTTRTLELLQAATQGRIGLHSRAVPQEQAE